MGKDKYYDPNEVDIVQAKNEKREAEIKKDVKYQKQVNRKKKSDDEEEKADVEREIIKKYGSFVVKEDHLIKKDLTTIYALNCFKCNVIKIAPYDFLTASGYDNGKGKCTTCMSELTKRVKKYKVKCPCGMSYIASDLGQSKHEVCRTHINGLKQLKATGLTIVYKMPSLRKIFSVNNIKYYNTLKIDEILKELKKLDKIIIPEDLPENLV